MAVKKTTKASEATSAINNMFGSAVAAPAPAKAKKNEYETVKMSDSVAHYAALTVAIDSLSGHKATAGATLEQESIDLFLSNLVKNGAKPQTIIGVHGDSSVQIQFKNKASLSQEIVDRMAKNNVAFTKVEEIPERFVINPAIFADQDKLGKLAIALQGLGFVDVIQKQQGQFKFKVADSTFADIAKISDPMERAELMRATSTIALAQAKIVDDVEPAITSFARLIEWGLVTIKSLVAKK